MLHARDVKPATTPDAKPDNGLGVPLRRFTVDEVLKMDEVGILRPEESVELIDGVLYKKQAKNFPRERYKAELIRLVVRALPDDKRLFVAPSIRLDPDLLEPDIVVIAQPTLARQGESIIAASGNELLLAIEVADTSLVYDRRLKAAAYARHGVPDYWIVDVRTPALIVHREPQPSGEWGIVRRFAADMPANPLVLPDLAIRLADFD